MSNEKKRKIKALGVMQGRLLPKYLGRYQAFPPDTWREEFAIARDIGLDCIEFILDEDTAAINPLLSQQGIEEIIVLTQKTNVKVITICADYFMTMPLFSKDKAIAQNSLNILKKLLINGRILGVTDIVIPCVDQSSMLTDPDCVKYLVAALKETIDFAESSKINLALETDFPPLQFLDLIKVFNSKRITVNYDTGNSASLGYNIKQEMSAYGCYISTLHIKDRKKNGGSVILGTGNADIDLVVLQLQKYNFQGPIILQPFRDDEGLKIFKAQLIWFRSILEKYYSLIKVQSS